MHSSDYKYAYRIIKGTYVHKGSISQDKKDLAACMKACNSDPGCKNWVHDGS